MSSPVEYEKPLFSKNRGIQKFMNTPMKLPDISFETGSKSELSAFTTFLKRTKRKCLPTVLSGIVIEYEL